jgi:hypothetical protein
MKNQGKKKRLTFGEFVEGVYNVYGKRRAGGFVRMALKSHMVELRRH